MAHNRLHRVRTYFDVIFTACILNTRLPLSLVFLLQHHTPIQLNYNEVFSILLPQDRGADVINKEEYSRLQQRERTGKIKKLHFFSSEDGWMLRPIVRAHPVQRAPKKFRALCGISTGNSNNLRARPNSRNRTCFVNFYDIRNEQKTKSSWYQVQHNNEKLQPWTYCTSTARNGASTEIESENFRHPLPEPQQQTPLLSTKLQERTTSLSQPIRPRTNRTRGHVSI